MNNWEGGNSRVKYTLLEATFSGLMHDIGKFYQRTCMVSNLSEKEKDVTPVAKAGYHTHLHSGYTSRFFQQYLNEMDEFERITSSHHISENNELAILLKEADCIASAIDRKDEEKDIEENNKKGAFQISRLSSIIGEVDFGKSREEAKFELNAFSKEAYPKKEYVLKPKQESVEEYWNLWNDFIADFNKEKPQYCPINKYAFDRMYALLYEYATYVPASTFEGDKTYVSLFDHLKLTSAIASCLYLNDTEDKKFVMLEFDVSGIQKFIFKVTEGKDTKSDIAKALRGRSFFISAITNIITYSYLHEFGLTQSNIIFNTGGGALLLLPKCKDYEKRILEVTKTVQDALFSYFGTDISYVYATVECDEKELEEFKMDKATTLKSMLEDEKSKKFHNEINDDFFFETTSLNKVCKMCGTNLVKDSDDICDTCKNIKEIAEYFVKHTNMYLVYDFHQHFKDGLEDSVCIDLGFMQLYLVDDSSYETVVQNSYDYIESLNHSRVGNTRWIANLVPQNGFRILSFEEIAEKLIGTDYGDPKLGVLKMDVDNLGAIFAFGLDKTRSLSKYLTLSRLMEAFFGYHLVKICKEVSNSLNPHISSLTSNDSMFYINYAGGDDLVIIGPVVGIIELANTINDKFNAYTLNDNITISGGITIQSPSAPIRFGIQEAEEYLNISKSLDGKNAITFLNTSLSMNELKGVLQKAKEYKAYIVNNKILRTNFYNLMHVLDIDRWDMYLQRIPRIMYSLKRNVIDETTRSILVKDISTKTDIQELKKTVLEMKLAIMQTRR